MLSNFLLMGYKVSDVSLLSTPLVKPVMHLGIMCLPSFSVSRRVDSLPDVPGSGPLAQISCGHYFPSDWQEQNTGKRQRQLQWKALEELYNTGKARSIGISHYCPRHIHDILEIATVRPTLTQVEYHVG